LEQFLRNFLLAKLDGSSTTQAQPSKLKNSSRNCSQVLFLHLLRKRNGTLNYLGTQAVLATNCQPRNATCIVSKNYNRTKEGVTTPNEDDLAILHQDLKALNVLVLFDSTIQNMKLHSRWMDDHECLLQQ